MKFVKRIIVTALVFGASLLLSNSIASASEEESFKERIMGFEFDIPYKESEVYIVKSESEDGLIGTIEVYDNQTGKLIDKFSAELAEVINLPSTQLSPESISTQDMTTQNISYYTIKRYRPSAEDNGV